MLTYREIRNEEQYAKEIWDIEEAGPQWFTDASHVWTPDFDAFMAFWRNCGEIWGLFDDDRLMALVYLEFRSPTAVNIHISAIRKLEEAELVRFYKSLVRKKALDGVTVMTAWLLKKNRPLRRVGAAAGFLPTGLRMTFGASRGRALEWIQVRQ